LKLSFNGNPMSALLGKKLGMTQVFTEKGDCVPVTVVQVERCVPVLKRTVEKDGYDAVLLGYGNRKPKHTSKPLQGFYDKHKVSPARVLKEFRNQDVDDGALGQSIKVDVFSPGDEVEVVGVTKGRGFAGVFKRYNYGGAPASHGHHESYRGTGSVGMHTYPGRVLKGMGMPGRMGGKTKHLKNLKVVRVDVENSLLLLRGSVPGANGGLLRIFKS